MTTRKDIEEGDLIYTCNCGWLDLDHVRDNSSRPFIGARNLWRQIRDGDLPPGVDPNRLYDHPGPSGLPYVDPLERLARFHDGAPGYKVTYKQDMGKWGVTAGVSRTYLVRYRLSPKEKREVALAIFVEVSELFEGFQGRFPWNIVTGSGFSQEDLVSNLLSFYIGIGDYTLPQVLALCKKVSTEAALAIWDREGNVEEKKDKAFRPAFAKEPGEECAGSDRAFPKAFSRVQPAIKGGNFRDFPGMADIPYPRAI